MWPTQRGQEWNEVQLIVPVCPVASITNTDLVVPNKLVSLLCESSTVNSLDRFSSGVISEEKIPLHFHWLSKFKRPFVVVTVLSLKQKKWQKWCDSFVPQSL